VHEQLAAIVADFDAAQARLRRLAGAVPEARWAVRAHPGRWSVAECVAHLNLTGRAYVPLLRAGVEAARTLSGGTPLGGGAARRYRRDPVGWLIGVLAGPLPRVGRVRLGRVRTTAPFVPHEAPARAAALAEFDALQAEQVGLVRAGDGLPLDRVRVTSPFDARVRYNLYACLAILPRHQHRHLAQAEAVWPA
jgi:hypothetical protein